MIKRRFYRCKRLPKARNDLDQPFQRLRRNVQAIQLAFVWYFQTVIFGDADKSVFAIDGRVYAEHLDNRTLRAAAKLFDEYFPDFLEIRHAIAHAGAVGMGTFRLPQGRWFHTAAGCAPAIVLQGRRSCFRVCMQFLECPLHEGSFLPAIVQDPREIFGASTAVQRQKDGNQVAMLKVASSDGGFLVFASTLGPNGPQLRPGNFVAWQAAEHSKDVAASMGAKDERSDWVGLILGTLRPEHRNGNWIGNEWFKP